MTDKVKQDALGPGYYTLSQEVIPEYAGDYIVLSRVNGSNNAFLESESWNNIPAFKNNRVIELDTESISYSDPACFFGHAESGTKSRIRPRAAVL